MSRLAEASAKDDLRKLVREDESLGVCRELADSVKRGYAWVDNLLFHEVLNEDGEVLRKLVLPMVMRQKAL